MKVEGVYIFKSDSGYTLYSKKTSGVEEDLFSAFLTALKSFFSNFALGGLSSFSSDNYIVYLASTNNVLTALIIDNMDKSEKYFNLAFEISKKFYIQYKTVVDNPAPIVALPNLDKFEATLNKLLDEFVEVSIEQQDIINLYKINTDGDLIQFEFIDENQLFQIPLFIAVNYITRQIFIFENSEIDIPSRQLFFASKATTNLNQRDFKSEFEIRNISDPWDFERLVEQISKLLKKESIQL